jgi:hypothetical protein
MENPITAELLETIDNYLKGILSEAENLAFEKQMKIDAELEETVKIQKQLFQLHDFNTIEIPTKKDNQEDLTHYKNQLRTKENIDLQNKIREIGINHTKTNSRIKKNYLKYYIAASIALIFGTFIFLNSNSSLESYYKENVNWEELPSFIDKGQTENYFTKGEGLFKNKEYLMAIESFKKIDTNNELYPYALMYIGASYDQLNQNQKAINTFDTLSKLVNFQEHSKGYWYKMLIFLKQNKKEKALEMKNIILKDQNNFGYDEAIQLKL